MTINFDETFDWFDVLERLTNGERANGAQRCKLEAMASSWPTCACGQLCKNLPRTEDKVPIDIELGVLGGRFASLVRDLQWKEALKCFNQIEARSSKLLGIKLVPRHKLTATTEKPFAITMGQGKHVTQETKNRQYA